MPRCSSVSASLFFATATPSNDCRLTSPEEYTIVRVSFEGPPAFDLQQHSQLFQIPGVETLEDGSFELVVQRIHLFTLKCRLSLLAPTRFTIDEEWEQALARHRPSWMRVKKMSEKGWYICRECYGRVLSSGFYLRETGPRLPSAHIYLLEIAA